MQIASEFGMMTRHVPLVAAAREVSATAAASASTQRHALAGARADHVRVIWPLGGAIAASRGRTTLRVASNEALLVFQSPDLVLERPGAPMRIVDVPAIAIQAAAFAAWGEPRRVNRGAYRLSAAQAALLRDAEGVLASPEKETSAALAMALADVLRRLDVHAGCFPIVRSVERAVLSMRADLPDLSIERIVRAAGVTLPVLRRNFRACAGMTLNRYVLEARLEWVRQCLGRPTETRSISELSVAASMRVEAFTRAYHRRFGETPTQTRARHFKSRGR